MEFSLDAVEFADNPDPRCPAVLLAEDARLMSGAPITALNEGLNVFQQDIQQDDLARRRTEVAIITFGGQVQTAQEFVVAGSFAAPSLKANGSTPMGEAIVRGLDLLRARKDVYRENGIAYDRPWSF